METGYKADGWLGALLGTKLYFKFNEIDTVGAKLPRLAKELGNAGKRGSG